MTSASVSTSPSAHSNAATQSSLPWRTQLRLAQSTSTSPGHATSSNATTSSDGNSPQTGNSSLDSSASPADKFFDWATRQGIPLQKAITMAQRLEARLKRRRKNPLPRRKPHRDQPKVVLNGGWLGAQDGVEATSGDSGQEGGSDPTESAWREQLKEPVGGVGGWLVFD